MNHLRDSDREGSADTPSLHELVAKLSELREHLDEVAARLNNLQREDSAAREDDHAPSARRRTARGVELGTLRCHECGRLSSSDKTGWTLRLCGDDELHPFCPSCDRRYVDGNGRGGSRGSREQEAPRSDA